MDFEGASSVLGEQEDFGCHRNCTGHFDTWPRPTRGPQGQIGVVVDTYIYIYS